MAVRVATLVSDAKFYSSLSPLTKYFPVIQLFLILQW